jgi:hypothetical protein
VIYRSGLLQDHATLLSHHTTTIYTYIYIYIHTHTHTHTHITSSH